MPPSCVLVGQLQMYADSPHIREGEIEVMVQFHGLLTYDTVGQYVVAVTIGFYAMPVLRETSKRFQGGLRVDVVETDAGFVPDRRRNMAIAALGDFLRRADVESKAFDRSRNSP
jgi:hypothetical protein